MLETLTNGPVDGAIDKPGCLGTGSVAQRAGQTSISRLLSQAVEVLMVTTWCQYHLFFNVSKLPVPVGENLEYFLVVVFVVNK